MKACVKKLLIARLAIIVLVLAAIVGVCAFALSGTQKTAWAEGETPIAEWEAVSEDGSIRIASSVGAIGCKVIRPNPAEGETTWQVEITSASKQIPPSVLKLTTTNGTVLCAYFNTPIDPGGNNAQVPIEGSDVDTVFTSAALFQTPPPSPPTVTFDMNGHGVQIDPVTANEDGTVTLPEDPAEEGWVFNGWTVDPGNETPFDPARPIESDITLYASWSEEARPLTVTFDMNGHGAEVTRQTEKGKPITLIDDPIADGYTFKGWAYDKEGKQAFDPKKNAEQDTTLYAQWEEKAEPKPDTPDKPSNSSNETIPKTGDNQNMSLVSLGLVGVALIAAGVALTAYRRRQA